MQTKQYKIKQVEFEHLCKNLLKIHFCLSLKSSRSTRKPVLATGFIWNLVLSVLIHILSLRLRSKSYVQKSRREI